jgi:hypothetical protein
MVLVYDIVNPFNYGKNLPKSFKVKFNGIKWPVLYNHQSLSISKTFHTSDRNYTIYTTILHPPLPLVTNPW